MRNLGLAALLAGAMMAPLAASAQAPAPAPAAAPAPARQEDPPPLMVEGKPLDVRPPEKPDDKPLFPEQTRAPYHASGVAFQVTTLPVKLTRPSSIAFLPDGKMLVTERGGALRLIDPKGVLSDPIANVPIVKVRSGLGLIEVVADPNFAKTRRLYLSFDLEQDGGADGIAVARATLSRDERSLNDVTVIFKMTALTAQEGNPDKGGRMAVGKDGYLYIGTGGRSKVAPPPTPQLLTNTLGKVVRITPDGKPAPGNPYIGKADAKPEIWSVGHRNPSGMTFDAQGRLWEIEHGPRGGDELNLVQKGKNYGWPIIAHGLDDNLKPLGEGLTAKPGLEQPQYYWDPVIAPAGIAYYDGKLFPKWKGSLFVGALRATRLNRLTIKGDKVVSEEPMLMDIKARIRDVREGPDGAIYVLTDDSRLLKITPK